MNTLICHKDAPIRIPVRFEESKVFINQIALSVNKMLFKSTITADAKLCKKL